MTALQPTPLPTQTTVRTSAKRVEGELKPSGTRLDVVYRYDDMVSILLSILLTKPNRQMLCMCFSNVYRTVRYNEPFPSRVQQ